MGRGGDNNLLGSFSSSKKARREKAEKGEEKKEEAGTGARNILFQSVAKPSNNIYAKKPTPIARRRAKEIANDLSKGEPLPLLFVLQKKDYKKGESPAFDAIFCDVARKRINQNFPAAKVGRSKESKLEKKSLEKEVAPMLAERIIDIFREDSKTEAKVAGIKELTAGLDQLIAEAVFHSEEEGPIKDIFLDETATTWFGDLDPDVLQAMLKRNASAKTQKVFQEIIQRHAVELMKRNLPYGARLGAGLQYGILRSVRKGPNLLHLVENRKTLCGKHGVKTHRVQYGDWVDGVRAGKFKRCKKCEKLASKDFLLRVESERSTMGQDILPIAQQQEIQKIATDKKIAAIARKGLREGKEPYLISDDIDHYILRRVATLTAGAADSAVSKNPSGRVIDYGSRHILWNNIDLDLQEKVRQAGYQIRNSYSRDKFKEEDVLLQLTTAQERRDALVYYFRSNETEDYEKSNEWRKKSETIVARSIRRALRNKKKKENKKEDTLF